MTEKNQIISGIMNGVVKKKLENIVFDIMSHPEEVPENIDDYVELARSMGFRDILEGFDLIDSEIGKIQRQRTIEKRKNRRIRQEEREFQEYLISHPEKLQEIEQGLKYLSHEKVVRSGRLDIDTVDKEGNEVRVELKARDVDSRENFFQIMKYFKEDDSGKSRLVFVAPFIKPDLLFSLRDYQQAGRMKFFEYDKDNGNYTFKEIKPEDFPEAVEIDWTKRKRKPVENGLVRVTAAVGKVRERKRQEAKETLKEIIFSEKWDSYPFYYKILLLSRPGLEDKEKYLKPIEIKGEQKHGLEELLNPSGLESALANFEEYSESYLSNEEEGYIAQNYFVGLPSSRWINDPLKFFEKGFALVKKYNNEASKMTSELFKIIGELFDFDELFSLLDGTKKHSDKEYEEVIDTLKKKQNTFDALIKEGRYQNKELSKFRNFLRRAIDKSAEDESRNVSKMYMQNLMYNSLFYNELMVSEFFRYKIKRARNLLEANRDLGISYLCFTPFLTSVAFETLVDILKMKAIENERVKIEPPIIVSLLEPSRIYEYIKEDNKLYQSILENLVVKEEPVEIVTEAARPEVVESEAIQPLAQEKAEHRKTKIHYGYPVSTVIPNRAYESLGKEKQAIVNEFVNGILNNPEYNNSIRKKYATLARESKWYNQNMDEKQARDFFGNLTINIEEECHKSKGK